MAIAQRTCFVGGGCSKRNCDTHFVFQWTDDPRSCVYMQYFKVCFINVNFSPNYYVLTLYCLNNTLNEKRISLWSYQDESETPLNVGTLWVHAAINNIEHCTVCLVKVPPPKTGFSCWRLKLRLSKKIRFWWYRKFVRVVSFNLSVSCLGGLNYAAVSSETSVRVAWLDRVQWKQLVWHDMNKRANPCKATTKFETRTLGRILFYKVTGKNRLQLWINFKKIIPKHLKESWIWSGWLMIWFQVEDSS